MRRARTILMVLVALAALVVIAVVLIVRPMASKYDPPEAVSGADGIWRIRNNVVDYYAAKTNDGVILFDAGLDSRGPALDALLGAAGGSKRDDVKAVFITHGHSDHVAGLLLLPQAKAYGSALEAPTMAGKGENKRPLPKVLHKIFGVKPVNLTDTLEGRAEVAVSGGSILAIPFAGHTAGSYLYVFRGVLFAGDAFNYDAGTLTLPPDIVTEDMAAVKRSIAQLPTLLQGVDVKIICTGHGGCAPADKTRALLDALVMQTNAQ